MNTRQHSTAHPHRVIIIGGGFGGLYAAKSLRRAPVEITLLDRRNFHLFQPLLYQVATGGLSPADISSPIRRVLRRQRNTRVLLAEVTGIEVEARRVTLGDRSLEYDTLIVATGASHHYFGHPEWSRYAPGLKTIEDATTIRRRVLQSFESAERTTDEDEREALLTFVVVGAGPTGVELAGALGELANDTLTRDFRSIDTRRARILLVEGADRVLTTYPPELSSKAEASLRRLGVEVRLNTMVSNIDASGVTVDCGDDTEVIPSRCVLWGAGVKASPLAQALNDGAGAELDSVGRVVVEEDLTVAGHPEIFVIGDMARFTHQTGQPLPGVAPVAMQQGRYAARTIQDRLDEKPVAPFEYFDKGNLATIGRKSAVADFGRLRFSGALAWLLWSGVHVLFLIEFQNRVLVMVQWAWNYVTRNRSARLIVGAAEGAEGAGGAGGAGGAEGRDSAVGSREPMVDSR